MSKNLFKINLKGTFWTIIRGNIDNPSQIFNFPPDLSNLDFTAADVEIKTEREPKTKVEIRAAKLREAKKTLNFCSEEYIDFNNNYSGISVMEWFFANYS